MSEPAPRSWKYRRRAAFISLGGAILGLGYLIVWGDDTRLHQDIASGLVWLAVSTVGIYVGGATLDDALRDKYAKGQRNEADNLAPHRRRSSAE